MANKREFITYRKPSAGYVNLRDYPKIEKAFKEEFRGYGYDFIPHWTQIEIDRAFIRELKNMEDHADNLMDEYANMLSIMVEIASDFYIKGFIDGREKPSPYRKDLKEWAEKKVRKEK